MTITKEKKKEIVEQICENIAKQDSLFFINFKGVAGNEANVLRNELKKSGAKMVVARKTLAKIAFEKEGIDFDPLLLSGEVGFVFSFEEGINTAKIIRKFEKEGNILLLGGIYGGNVLTEKEAKAIADLLTREQLLAKLLGTVSAPVGGFLNVLQGNTKGLINVLAKAKV